MITKRRMIVPIFEYKLTIIIFDDWEELRDYLPEEDFKLESKAITISTYGASLVAINSKIVESAVNFWFKDNDYKGSNKVHDYFKEA